MSSDHVDAALELFREACELAPDERASFLERTCGGDAALRAEVESMLAWDDAEDEEEAETDAVHPVRQVLEDLARPSQPAPAPEQIGPYRILSVLGEGGMGTVYIAQQKEPVRRQVALKVIKLGMDTAMVLQRFEAEQQALAMMEHGNIAKVFEAGTTERGQPFFAMEYVKGRPITQYCDDQKLSLEERLDLFRQVCSGVQHAHQKGVIHRDLKPSNVLISDQDGKPTAKIIDFGIARATDHRLVEATIFTEQGVIVGTPEYMSPEQAGLDALDIDTRSDVYALGVLLYELLVGELPFSPAELRQGGLREMERMIREQDPPRPSTRLTGPGAGTAVAESRQTDVSGLARRVKGDLDWIAMKALEKNRDRRYQTAIELAQDVERHLADEPVLARPPSAAYRVVKFVRRHRVGVGAGALVCAGLLAGAFGIVAGRLEAESKRAEVLRLSDGYRLAQIEVEAEALWPPHPDAIGELGRLRDRAEELLKNLPAHRATLAGRNWNLESTEDRWQHELLSELTVGLERLRSDLVEEGEPTTTFGWSIPKRLEAARGLEEDDGGLVAAAWHDALPRIREAYQWPEFKPQMGLMPLGQDPDSKLWEFAHLLSGEPAERDPDTGRIVPTDGMGIVLVLIPGGTFTMGAQRDDPNGNFDPYLEPHDARKEGPPREVSVSPFFLSKFEITWSQWERFVGTNPSAEQELGEPSALRPVTAVSWTDCQRTTRRLGLTLPTEEQWEYAARAGTDTPWWTGAEPETLQGAENLYDLTLHKNWPGAARATGDLHVEWSDGVATTSPVGTFLANPFGLYDVLGNVVEWCSPPDGHSEGVDRVPGDVGGRQTRGGLYRGGWYTARVTFGGNGVDGNFAHPSAGLRPAREVER